MKDMYWLSGINGVYTVANGTRILCSGLREDEARAVRDALNALPKPEPEPPLKPCPFCGRSMTERRKEMWSFVWCAGCGARGPEDAEMAVAIAVWNRRARDVDGNP